MILHVGVPDNSHGKDLYIMNLVHGLVWRDDKLLPKICLTNHRLHCRLRRIIEKCKKSVPAGLQFLPSDWDHGGQVWDHGGQ
jgi:hypothetical protein